MLKKLTLLVFLLLFSFSNAQKREIDSLSILIYSEGQGFLQPFIESTIKNLVNTSSKKPYFFKVNSFNRFISDNKYQAELSDLIGTQKPENVQLNIYYSDEEKAVRKRIFDILTDYQYFLTVSTNTLGELIEFQFQLFETVTSDKKDDLRNIPYNISDKVIGVENFFINPKEANYSTSLKML